METPFISFFGHSVVFGNKIAEGSSYAADLVQPFLFQSDWFFVDWPFQFIYSLYDPKHYYHTDEGFVSIGFAFVWAILAIILLWFMNIGRPVYFQEDSDLRHLPFSSSRFHAMSKTPAILLIPFAYIINIIWAILFIVFGTLLYWHYIVYCWISLLITGGIELLTGGHVRTMEITNALIFWAIFLPPIINITLSLFHISIFLFAH